MSTALFYLCDQCGRPCCNDSETSPSVALCYVCNLSFDFAPWSYMEVIGMIGLEGMYQIATAVTHRALALMPDRAAWCKLAGWQALQPAQYILALQAGVVFSTEEMLQAAQHQAREMAIQAQLRQRRN